MTHTVIKILRCDQIKGLDPIMTKKLASHRRWIAPISTIKSPSYILPISSGESLFKLSYNCIGFHDQLLSTCSELLLTAPKEDEEDKQEAIASRANAKKNSVEAAEAEPDGISC